ncbi:MAG: amidohydrolase family protein [Spirochaetes bacterium]|nr:amidohydrolase family protein [Spirochaetota bacterium]
MIPEAIIDSHVHLFPDKLFRAIGDYFLEQYGWRLIYQLNYRDCIDLLIRAGVERIVYSNYAHRPGIAREINRWNLQVLGEYSNLFCFAAYHPGDGDALRYAEEVMAHPRTMGIKLHFLVQRFAPDDERLFPLYELVIEKKKRLLLHVGTGPIGNEFVGLERFTRVLERYPELSVNVAHLGALEYRGFFALLDHYPGIMMDTAFTFLPNLPGGYDLGIDLLERYHDRILYGSDFPFLIVSRDTEIESLVSLGLSSRSLESIFRNNARWMTDHC